MQCSAAGVLSSRLGEQQMCFTLLNCEFSWMRWNADDPSAASLCGTTATQNPQSKVTWSTGTLLTRGNWSKAVGTEGRLCPRGVTLHDPIWTIQQLHFSGFIDGLMGGVGGGLLGRDVDFSISSSVVINRFVGPVALSLCFPRLLNATHFPFVAFDSVVASGSRLESLWTKPKSSWLILKDLSRPCCSCCVCLSHLPRVCVNTLYVNCAYTQHMCGGSDLQTLEHQSTSALFFPHL